MTYEHTIPPRVPALALGRSDDPEPGGAYGTTHQSLSSQESGMADYHLARARGGVGLTILGAASVHSTAPMEIATHLDSVVPDYQRFMEALAPYDMKMMQQLWHPGSAGHTNALGDPLWSASDVPNPVRGLTRYP